VFFFLLRIFIFVIKNDPGIDTPASFRDHETSVMPAKFVNENWAPAQQQRQGSAHTLQSLANEHKLLNSVAVHIRLSNCSALLADKQLQVGQARTSAFAATPAHAFVDNPQRNHRQ